MAPYLIRKACRGTAQLFRMNNCAHNSASGACTLYFCRIYTDLSSGRAQLEHPLLDYYRGAVFMDKARVKHMLHSCQAQPSTSSSAMLQMFDFYRQASQKVMLTSQCNCQHNPCVKNPGQLSISFRVRFTCDAHQLLEK